MPLPLDFALFSANIRVVNVVLDVTMVGKDVLMYLLVDPRCKMTLQVSSCLLIALIAWCGR